MIRLAIYARVSTDNQDYNRQIEDLSKKIDSDYHGQDYEIVVFSENVSGFSDNKIKLNELDNIINETPNFFDCIYVSELNRLGRKPNDINILISKWDKLGVVFYIGGTTNQRSALSDGTRNSMLWMSISMFAEYASIESAFMKSRSKSGLLSSVRKGKAGGSANLPYGYRKDDDKMLLVDDGEAVVIKRIFQLYKEGNGIKVIANILNDDGILTRGKKIFAGRTFNRFRKDEKTALLKGQKVGEKISEIVGDNFIFSDKTIHDILSNTIYKGDRKYKDIVIKAPPIIDTHLFDECTTIRENKTHKNHLTTYTYLLRNILICGCCGKTYMGRYKPVHKQDKIYVCPSRLKRGGTCGNVGINIVFIESVIYDCFIDIERINKELSDNINHKSYLENEIKMLRNLLKIEIGKKSGEKIDNLVDLYVNGRINDLIFDTKKLEIENENEITKKNIEKINLKITDITNVLKRLSQNKLSDNALSNAKDNRFELKSLYNQFIDKLIIIKLDNKHVLVTIFTYLDGVIKTSQIHLLLNISGMLKKPKKYSYKLLTSISLVSPIEYVDGILISNREMIINDFATNKNSQFYYEVNDKNIIDNIYKPTF